MCLQVLTHLQRRDYPQPMYPHRLTEEDPPTSNNYHEETTTATTTKKTTSATTWDNASNYEDVGGANRREHQGDGGNERTAGTKTAGRGEWPAASQAKWAQSTSIVFWAPRKFFLCSFLFFFFLSTNLCVHVL
jgi:hypothetical protein